MSREFKKYRLRATRKPMRHALIASAVRVVDEYGRSGYAYIGFDEPFVEAVGKRLPRGVSRTDQAYITVVYDEIREQWAVAAHYLRDAGCAHLWYARERPTWLTYTTYEAAHAADSQDATIRHRPLDAYRASPGPGKKDSAREATRIAS